MAANKGNCALLIHLNKSTYANGELLSGYIKLDLIECLAVKLIKVRIGGFERGLLYMPPNTNTYFTQTFYKNDLIVWSKSSIDDKDMEPGEYTFPFSFQLPSHLPPSVNYMDFVSVYYLVNCSFEASNDLEYTDSTFTKSIEFFLYGVGKKKWENILSVPKPITVKANKAFWYNKTKPIELSAHLPRADFRLGDKVQLHVKVRNHTSTIIDTIQVSLIQSIALDSTDSQKKLTTTRVLDQTFSCSVPPLVNTPSRENNAYLQNDSPPNSEKTSRSASPTPTPTPTSTSTPPERPPLPLSSSTSSLDYSSSQLSKKFSQSLGYSSIPRSQSGADLTDFKETNKVDPTTSSMILEIKVPLICGDDEVFPSTRGKVIRISHSIIVQLTSPDLNVELPVTIWDEMVEDSNAGEVQNDHNGSGNGISTLLDDDTKTDLLESRYSEEVKTQTPRSSWSVNWIPNWVEDSSVNNCPICNAEFGIFNRKHHCRSCGDVVCDDCSSQKLSIKEMGYRTPVRVCNLCYKKRNTQVTVTPGNTGNTDNNTTSDNSSDNVEKQRLPAVAALG